MTRTATRTITHVEKINLDEAEVEQAILQFLGIQKSSEVEVEIYWSAREWDHSLTIERKEQKLEDII